MEARHGSFSEYTPLQESWDEYGERREQYFVANDIDQPDKKRAILHNACRPTTYKLFRSLTAPDKPNKVEYDALKVINNDESQYIVYCEVKVHVAMT